MYYLVAMIKNTLFEFWLEQEKVAGKRIQVSEVARATGLHHNTIQKMLQRETNRFDASVIAALCKFFGVPSGSPVPFLIFESDESTNNPN